MVEVAASIIGIVVEDEYEDVVVETVIVLW